RGRFKMKLLRRKFVHLAAGAAVLPVAAHVARAQAYPARAVRVIVPFAPGGLTDVFARLAAQKLTEHFGRQFYVENISGGSGNIGTGQAARSTPDGYTLLFAYTSHVVNPSVFAKIPYHPIKDFAPVTLAVGSATVLSVNPSLPAGTVKELVALIRANPGKYNIASPGAGTTTLLTGEQFRTSLALDLAQVPFNGAGPAIASVIAGHTQIMFSAVASAASQIKAGQLRPLAVTGKTRSAILPEVPTTTEAGYPDIEGDGWVGVLVPAGTPTETITSRPRGRVRILALRDMKERLPTLGFEPIGNTTWDIGLSKKQRLTELCCKTDARGGCGGQSRTFSAGGDGGRETSDICLHIMVDDLSPSQEAVKHPELARLFAFAGLLILGGGALPLWGVFGGAVWA